ncbi:MAG: hypothetical protein DSY90_09735 [Deltaproteobacteria bacterium]|nr:MAG: hypothetical protein DSY90_09735 [Deltaproteobacteria bacterium]
MWYALGGLAGLVALVGLVGLVEFIGFIGLLELLEFAGLVGLVSLNQFPLDPLPLLASVLLQNLPITNREMVQILFRMEDVEFGIDQLPVGQVE